MPMFITQLVALNATNVITPVTILAVVFAVIILLKAVMGIWRPQTRLKFAKAVWKRSELLSATCLLFLIIIGYFILLELTIVQVAAVMLFTTILMGLNMAAYPKAMEKLINEVLRKRSRFWASMIIWVVIALWVLYAVFV
ncbi:MAG: hypothetical protein ISS36_01575 [Candidatus Aenigmarchaeota archaeon]|nr:hypothetical protein [Candidatus Aenigmarchaeota archaeon]